jgi:hypothetical protein
MGRIGALMACLLLTAPVAAAAGAGRVSIEVSAREADAADALALVRVKQLLTARLAQEGFAVVPVEGAHDVGLSLSFGGAGWAIRATIPTETLARDVSECGILQAEDQLEIVQKATELVRKALLRVTEAAAAAPSPPSPPPPTAPPPQTEPPPPAATQTMGVTMVAKRPAAASSPAAPGSSTEIEVSTGIDLLIRALDVDPMARIGGRLSLGPRLGVHLTTGLSDSSAGQLEVLEGQALVGLGYRLIDTGRLRLEAAVMGGLLVHHYASALDSGNRTDELGLMAFTGDVRVWRHVGLELRVAPGLSETEYTQLAGDAVTWSRSRFRIEAGAGLILY